MQAQFRMVDVGNKSITHRVAIAEGRICLSATTFEHVRTRTLPKGDARLLAEIAGIQGAKQTSQLIPLCHPLPLDHVQVITELDASAHAVHVYCVATAQAKTGVEMEALAGVQAALLTLWDLCKMIDPEMRIEQVRLLAKRGGKSGLWFHNGDVPDWVRAAVQPPTDVVPVAGASTIRIALVTLSDRAATGQYTDRSGPLAQSLLTAAGFTVDSLSLLTDDPEALRACLIAMAHEGTVQLVITLGGTGISSRDRAPDTIMGLADRIIPGIGEQLRQYGAQFTPFSWSSRSLAATYGRLLIIALPGSPKAIREGLTCLLPQIPHLVQTLHDHKHHPL